ncbi:hypothetical protein G8O24_24075 [Bradyrhizobium sp. INPA01-394B]|uniref:Uncharacterized protein n=1 Tax=Bradyrhizobium campsiandrae TaxID=1729892 RepID=A0ABR7UDN4_9BRAD|nr:hypothetical protein [Bradyrhizobium campsiandrae]MBC9880406.1 hypothetical protein [Bradyrhizobium campsiandrae]MBC9981982.1 hypothetical protein [Bradyrhizobium campsiandrae]
MYQSLLFSPLKSSCCRRHCERSEAIESGLPAAEIGRDCPPKTLRMISDHGAQARGHGLKAVRQRSQRGTRPGDGPQYRPGICPWRSSPSGNFAAVLLPQAGGLWNFWQVQGRSAGIRALDLS